MFQSKKMIRDEDIRFLLLIELKYKYILQKKLVSFFYQMNCFV